jgi:hypothetical protein
MDELREWRLTPEGKKQSKRNKGNKGGARASYKKGSGDSKRQKVMAASVNKQVEKRLAELSKKEDTDSFEEPSREDARAYIMSLLEEKKPTVSSTTVRGVTNEFAKVTLKSVLARSKIQK